MHARLEPPLTQEQSSRSWPRVSQPAGAKTAKSSSKQTIVDGSDSAAVGADSLRKSLLGNAPPDAGHGGQKIHRGYRRGYRK
jgi:hypothetical protein